LNRARRWVYPFYIWHQTVTVVLGYAVLELALPAGWLHFLLLVSSLMATVLVGELPQHSAVSRFLGIRCKMNTNVSTATPPRLRRQKRTYARIN